MLLSTAQLVRHALAVLGQVHGLQDRGDARLDLRRVDRIDTAGAWLVHQTLRRLREQGLDVALDGADAAATTLIAAVGHSVGPHPAPLPAENPLTAVLLRLGRATVDIGQEARNLISFLGHTVIVLGRSLARPGRIRGTALISRNTRTTRSVRSAEIAGFTAM